MDKSVYKYWKNCGKNEKTLRMHKLSTTYQIKKMQDLSKKKQFIHIFTAITMTNLLIKI